MILRGEPILLWLRWKRRQKRMIFHQYAYLPDLDAIRSLSGVYFQSSLTTLLGCVM